VEGFFKHFLNIDSPVYRSRREKAHPRPWPGDPFGAPTGGAMPTKKHTHKPSGLTEDQKRTLAIWRLHRVLLSLMLWKQFEWMLVALIWKAGRQEKCVRDAPLRCSSPPAALAARPAEWRSDCRGRRVVDRSS